MALVETRDVEAGVDAVPTESTALLPGAGHGNRRTPLPKAQLASLYLAKLVVPVAATQFLPYVNHLVLRFGFTDNPRRVGFYSGLIESTAPIVQIISTYPWGRLSDTSGRKPVVLGGAFGLGAAALMFGLSRTLLGVLLARVISGLFAGTVATMHSVVGELTDETNQSVAFPLYDLCSSLGYIIGPMIGGQLENPAERWASFSSTFWRMYPYALPGFATAVLALLAVFASSLSLEETLPGKRRADFTTRIGFVGATIAEDDPTEVPSDPPGTRELLAQDPLRSVLVAGTALAFITAAYNALFVLFAYSPHEYGGLGFLPSDIATALAISGSIAVVLKSLIMPRLLQRYKILDLYLVLMGAWPVTFALFPVLSAIGQRVDPGGRLLWASVVVVAAMSQIACLAFSVSMILVRESAPSAASLGAANGLAEVSQSLAMALSPLIVSSLFSLSVEKLPILPGYTLAVGFMIAVSLFGTWTVYRVQSKLHLHIDPSTSR